MFFLVGLPIKVGKKLYHSYQESQDQTPLSSAANAPSSDQFQSSQNIVLPSRGSSSLAHNKSNHQSPTEDLPPPYTRYASAEPVPEPQSRPQPQPETQTQSRPLPRSQPQYSSSERGYQQNGYRCNGYQNGALRDFQYGYGNEYMYGGRRGRRGRRGGRHGGRRSMGGPMMNVLMMEELL